MAFGLEVTNTDGSILIGDTPPLLQVIESGTIELVANDINAAGYYSTLPASFFLSNFSIAKMPVSCLGKQWAFNFTGDASNNVPYNAQGYTTLPYGCFIVSCNNNGTLVPGILMPKSRQGQSISYIILDYPIAATSGYGLELRNAANQVILSTSRPMFLYKNAVNDLTYGSWDKEPLSAYPPSVGSSFTKTLTIPTGKTPYILGSNYLRDVFINPAGGNRYNYAPVTFNILSFSNSSITFRMKWSLVTHEVGFYDVQLRDNAGFQHAKIQVGYVV